MQGKVHHDVDVNSGMMANAMEDPLAKVAPHEYALKRCENSLVVIKKATTMATIAICGDENNHYCQESTGICFKT